MMLPSFDDFAVFRKNLNSIGQNSSRFLLGKEEGGRIPLPLDRPNQNLLGVVPEPDCRDQCETPVKEAFGEIPSDDEPLPLGRIGLPRIGRADLAARQKIGVDPLLLDIEMRFIASCEEEES